MNAGSVRHHIALLMIAAGIATSLAVAHAVVLVPVNVSAQSTCGTDYIHWYGRATSGTGSSWGTEMIINMPWGFYAPTGTSTDEAAWVIDEQLHIGDPHSGLELGWFQGYWPYPGSGYGQNFAYPQGYITFDQGNTGFIITGQLPYNPAQLGFGSGILLRARLHSST